MPHLHFENMFNGPVCGVDEVGRGAWCGHVFACAAVMKSKKIPDAILQDIDDSKKLTRKKRNTLMGHLQQYFDFSTGRATVEEIDQLNIGRATMLAMKRAIHSVPIAVVGALIDGNMAPSVSIPCKTVVKGDTISLSIAAASIIAKVTRDTYMADLAKYYPHYGWEKNVGYGTKMHKNAIEIYGITPHHRKSYAPIKKYL